MKRLSIFLVLLGLLFFTIRARVIVNDHNKLSVLYSAFLAEAILSLNNGQDIIKNLLSETSDELSSTPKISLLYEYDVEKDTIFYYKESQLYMINESQLDSLVFAVDSLIKLSIKQNGVLMPYFINPDAYISNTGKPYTSILAPYSSSFFQDQWKKEKESNNNLNPIDFIHRWIFKIKNTPLTIYKVDTLPTKRNLQEWEDSVRKLPRETIRLNF